MRHPRKANQRPHDHPRRIIAERKKHARAAARGLANVIDSLR